MMTTGDVLAEIQAEMIRARELHGDGYMGNTPRIVYCNPWSMDKAIDAGIEAKQRLDALKEGDHPAKTDILIEEVGELMSDLKDGLDGRKELIQVAAMALAWLGVEPVDIDIILEG